MTHLLLNTVSALLSEMGQKKPKANKDVRVQTGECIV